MRQSRWIISSKSHPFRAEWLSIFRPLRHITDTQLLITSLSCFRSAKSVFLFLALWVPRDKLRRPSIGMFLLKVSVLTCRKTEEVFGKHRRLDECVAVVVAVVAITCGVNESGCSTWKGFQWLNYSFNAEVAACCWLPYSWIGLVKILSFYMEY